MIRLKRAWSTALLVGWRYLNHASVCVVAHPGRDTASGTVTHNLNFKLNIGATSSQVVVPWTRRRAGMSSPESSLVSTTHHWHHWHAIAGMPGGGSMAVMPASTTMATTVVRKTNLKTSLGFEAAPSPAVLLVHCPLQPRYYQGCCLPGPPSVSRV